jgi:hypothetical protein
MSGSLSIADGWARARCETCRFSDASSYPQTRCRHNAPLVTGGLHGPTETVWPQVHVTDWCGEYQSRDGKGWLLPNDPEPVEEECPF